mmetsp:Transcript_4605/g.15448  ORF Transcript_4605/g.15448 Transcript_4605/m.15448 type:complete len:210 (+) Transcript_4605:41-670(+)
MPWPPPMHALPRAVDLPVRCSSCARCPRMRAPEAPRGCPRAMAPPFTLKRSRSTPSSFSTESTCPAKASFTSTRSTSPRRTPAASSRPRAAGTGPMPMTVGSHPTRCQPTTRARGASPRRATASSSASTRLAAPSQMPEALPAVTTPSLRNTGLSLPRPSAVVAGRGCSSTATSSTSPRRRPGTDTGATSALNTPASCAAPHACWLRAA